MSFSLNKCFSGARFKSIQSIVLWRTCTLAAELARQLGHLISKK